MTTRKKLYTSIADEVSRILGDEMVVELQEIKKINVSYDGITIRKQGESIAPTIYLNQYYSQFNDGREIADIAKEIIEVYKNNQPDKIVTIFDVKDFYDYDKIKSDIVIKVVNTKKNTDLLENIPNVSMQGLGLSVVFYLTLMTDSEEGAGILIQNEHLKLWNKEISDLLEVAKDNTNRIHKFMVKSLNEIMSEAFGIEEELVPDDVPQLYVLTDENKTFGASAMYCKDKIREFAQKVDADLYILPSSVHELLLMKADFENVDPAYLKEMVFEVNASEVSEADFLCDGLFKYILSEDKIIAL